MPSSRPNRFAVLVALLSATGVCLACVGCSGKGEGGEVAVRAAPSGIPAAAPRALGPGAATLTPTVREAPPEPPGTEPDPFAPFLNPDGGVAPPPKEALPL
jgi:hypothetical protein